MFNCITQLADKANADCYLEANGLKKSMDPMSKTTNWDRDGDTKTTYYMMRS